MLAATQKTILTRTGRIYHIIPTVKDINPHYAKVATDSLTSILMCVNGASKISEHIFK